MFILHVLYKGMSSRFPLQDQGRWRLGRKEPCEIVVPDPRISAEHAELQYEDENLVLRRTKGRNAIVYDGRAVTEAVLREGSSFDIGDTNFTLAAEQDGLNVLDTRTVLAGTWSSFSVLEHAPPDEEDDEQTRALNRRKSPSAAVPGRLVAQVGYLLKNAQDRQTLAELVLDLACQRMDAQRALLARVEGAEHLDLEASRGFPEHTTVAELISKSALRQLVDGQRAVLIADTERSASKIASQQSVLRNHIRTIACTPIFDSEGALRSLLYVDNPDRPSAFTIQDAELLIWLGQVYGLLSENLEMGRQLDTELAVLKAAAVREAHVVAESPTMVKLLGKVKKAAASEANVLLMGESGTGKECIARLLHVQSPRAQKAIVARNCAAIPENLFESEMFGHKKGAFTGADRDRQGAFVEADGGTLFLDEIGDLDLALQTKLLRAIQEGRVQPVGSDKEVEVDVRLICATNRNLPDLVQSKEFRDDLYYRVATVVLEIPPLRERVEDIPALSTYFIERLSDNGRRLSGAAMQKLKDYAWPGNVRELLSVLEEAVIFSASDELTPDDLNLRMDGGQQIHLRDDALAEVERRHILQVLQKVDGNKTEAAKILGIARSTMVLKLKSYEQGERKD
ncbi:MAG: sigma 54-interacting transcriptional regulator [Planctomycetota bacterium]|nr:sigma 54-interacting transcriptional regulator [Planctomycetota bacterium]